MQADEDEEGEDGEEQENGEHGDHVEGRCALLVHGLLALRFFAEIL